MTSLNPSASFYVRNRGGGAGGEGGGGGGTGRHGYLPMRSASMRETSYSRSIRRRRQAANAPAAGNGQAMTGGGDTLSVNNEGIVVPSSSSSHNVSASIAEVHTNGTEGGEE